jgi:cyclophilin family peptidyl-prolyl cis-trans isomerase
MYLLIIFGFIMSADSRRKRSNIPKKKPPIKQKTLINSVIFIIAVIAVIAIIWYVSLPSDDTTSENGPTHALIKTSKGNMLIELFTDKVPKTCENFIRLAEDNFYDGMNFYRISDDFMIQAGRFFPDGSESQSPYPNVEFETHEDVKHVDGAISMASTGAGVGGSAEFFICDGAQSFLDGNYAPFGVVVDGLDVLRDIADEPHDNSNPAGGGKPNTDIIIDSIIIDY